MPLESIWLRLAHLHGERGQTMAEYAVVLGVITLAIVAAISVLQGTIIGALNDVQARV